MWRVEIVLGLRNQKVSFLMDSREKVNFVALYCSADLGFKVVGVLHALQTMAILMQ